VQIERRKKSLLVFSSEMQPILLKDSANWEKNCANRAKNEDFLQFFRGAASFIKEKRACLFFLPKRQRF